MRTREIIMVLAVLLGGLLLVVQFSASLRHSVRLSMPRYTTGKITEESLAIVEDELFERPPPQVGAAWDHAFTWVTDPLELLCTLLIFCSATLAASAGTGGGGMFVPLLLLFSSLKAELVVPLSQSMILFSSFVNLLTFAGQRHPALPDRSKIDYDCVVLLEPMLCFGVTLGVVGHQFSPKWLQLLLLCAILGSALWRTAKKGFKQRQEEAEKVFEPSPKRQVSAGILALPGMASRISGHANEFWHLVQSNKSQVVGIASVWFVMLACSFHRIPLDTWRFGVYVVALAVVLVVCTVTVAHFVVAAKHIRMKTEVHSATSPSGVASCSVHPAGPLELELDDTKSNTAKPIVWVADSNTSSCLHFPMVAFGAGLLGGSLGLGGGIIISPVLLEVGMHSEAVQATTATFVFLSSSLATVQYVVFQQVAWDFALWYGTFAVAATLLGQRICEAYVQRHKRYSMITLSIAGVLLFSLAALLSLAVRETLGEVSHG